MTNSTEEAPSTTKTATILIAASEQTRRQFGLVFVDSPYFILQANSDVDALRLARSARPDLILLAYQPPRFDALTLCATLHQAPESQHVPVVLLIENEDELLINRALESGASDYISYPIRANILRQRVRFLLRMHAMQETLLRQTAQLQARNDELDAFAHTVAHNLKNSVASMMMPASVALSYYDRMDDVQRQAILADIVDSGYKARAIIEAILLLAGVNRQNTVEIGLIDMHEVILSVQNRLHSIIAERHAKIVMPTHIPNAIGYIPWVEEVWANYLSNALKYGGTPPHITFGGKAQPDGFVRYWISDNGPGINAEDQSMLFTPFTRLSQAKIEGHGLGLSVVQRIVQKLGGQVGVESELGTGSTFWFTLPKKLI
jgi:signal transduction histidine kinase